MRWCVGRLGQDDACRGVVAIFAAVEGREKKFNVGRMGMIRTCVHGIIFGRAHYTTFTMGYQLLVLDGLGAVGCTIV